jgi:hypothetical protein
MRSASEYVTGAAPLTTVPPRGHAGDHGVGVGGGWGGRGRTAGSGSGEREQGGAAAHRSLDESV